MKLTSAWMQEWLRRTMLDSQLLDGLAQAGMEIEQVNYSQPIDDRVVVCSVKKVIQHPGADRLKLATVETGEGEYRVVCGAPNVREGIKVPFAQIGATLPGGETIGKVKLRGEVSEGMLCSAHELGLSDDHSGLLELPTDTPVGISVARLFPADTIVDVKTPANRFDVQSVLGLARDVAGMTGSPLNALPESNLKFTRDTEVLVAKPQAERIGLVKLAVKNAAVPSPDWLQARLRAAGMRPVSLLVDITNFVMLDVGQPLHAYDASRLHLPLMVRVAKAHERLVTLDGVERVLSPDDLVVADQDGVVGLAGVMGGQRTEVRAGTAEIWLEAAVFDGVRVRKTAQRLGLRTEASARFERGLPVELPELGLARAVALLAELAGAEVLAAVAAGPAKSPERRLTLPLVQLSKMLSFEIELDEATKALQQLQFELVHSSKNELTVTVPWWRPDVQRPVDLVEEVVRVLGYDRVPARIPAWRPRQMAFDRTRSRRRQVRDVLYAAGLFEVMTYSFVSHDQLAEVGITHAEQLKLKNPLSVEQAYLRSSLLPSHLTVAERNRTYDDAFGFYEISNVFHKRPGAELPHEPLLLAMTVLRPEQAYRAVKGLLDALGRELALDLVVQPADDGVFAPGRSGSVWLNGQRLGRIGQLHPRLVQSHKVTGEMAFTEFELTPLLEAAGPAQFKGLQRFPVIRRDVSVWLPVDRYWRDVQAVLADYDVSYVDVYTGAGTPDGQRGLTVRLTVARPDRTPTEAEADELTEAVLLRLERRLQAQRRD
ncbi:MAG TPA: phenylalanine--tRNA ligase subunit beta [Candidatus Saccharimonadia bacterium]